MNAGLKVKKFGYIQIEVFWMSNANPQFYRLYNLVESSIVYLLKSKANKHRLGF